MGKWIGQWLVDSDTDDTKSYKVSVDDEGRWECSCPRWIHQKGGRFDCKHIDRVKALLRQQGNGIIKIL